MATYTIVPQSAAGGFAIEVVGGNGARQTLLGFASEAEASAWIAQDERLNAAADPFRRTSASSLYRD